MAQTQPPPAPPGTLDFDCWMGNGKVMLTNGKGWQAQRDWTDSKWPSWDRSHHWDRGTVRRGRESVGGGGTGGL